MLVPVLSQSLDAEVIGGVNWADNVTAYTSNIQNYGSTAMDATTEFWVTGMPDADTDGNGYVWDAGDSDTVAGWRSSAPNESLRDDVKITSPIWYNAPRAILLEHCDGWI